MQKFFFFLVITFGILFVTNIIWIVLNLYFWATAGIDIVLSGSEKGLFQNIYYSLYFKWIVFADVLWIISSVIFFSDSISNEEVASSKTKILGSR